MRGEYVLSVFPGNTFPGRVPTLRTIFVLVGVSADNDKQQSSLLEMDVATAHVIRRRALPDAEQVFLAKAPDALHVLSRTDNRAMITTFNLDLRSTSSVAFTMSQKLTVHGFNMFSGHPVLLASNFEGKSFGLVYDSKGRMLAQHKCEARLRSELELTPAGDYVLIPDIPMLADEHDLACSFRWDGSGKVNQVDYYQADVYQKEDRFYLRYQNEDTMVQLGGDLRPIGKPYPVPPLPEPVPLPPGRDPDDWHECSGITGTATNREFKVGTVLVTHTYNCCMDTAPEGLFLCETGKEGSP